jgi:phage shock protein PspC (stress-responsive transcriptional regulator)
VNDRLYRSRQDRMFAGVAGGIAERFDLDPSLVRVLWVILMFLTGGLFFLLYVVMAIVVPEAPLGPDRWAAWSAGPPPPPPPPAPDAVPGWTPPRGTGEAFVPAATFAAGTPGAEAGPESRAEGAPEGTMPSGMPTGAPAGQPPAGPPPWSVPPAHRHREGRGGGAIIAGVFLVLLGAYFFVQSVAPETDLGPFWPLVLIAIGVAFLIGSIRPSGRGSAS